MKRERMKASVIVLTLAIIGPWPGGDAPGPYFAPPVIAYPSPFNAFPIHGAVGDFDNDQILDLVTTEAGYMFWLKGLGTGTFPFQSAVLSGPYPALQVPTILRAGDFDADGNLDVIVQANGGLLTCSGAGNGMFSSPVPVTSGTINRLVVSDVNGDS
jgi:hypothetical protein